MSPLDWLTAAPQTGPFSGDQAFVGAGLVEDVEAVREGPADVDVAVPRPARGVNGDAGGDERFERERADRCAGQLVALDVALRGAEGDGIAVGVQLLDDRLGSRSEDVEIPRRIEGRAHRGGVRGNRETVLERASHRRRGGGNRKHEQRQAQQRRQIGDDWLASRFARARRQSGKHCSHPLLPVPCSLLKRSPASRPFFDR